MITIPERIARAAEGRIAAYASERRRVWEKIRVGRPLDAEWDERRKIDRVQRVTGVSRDQAKALARHVDPRELGLSDEELLRAKVVQGDTADFLEVSFLEQALVAARAVCRLVLDNGTSYGTGFLISPRLLLTNNHVIPRVEAAAVLRAEFDYELQLSGGEPAVTRFRLDPAKLFVENADDDLDFTLVALDQMVLGARPVEEFGFCRLLAAEDKHRLAEFVNVVQHPKGQHKKVVLRENRVVTRLDLVLHYEADTEEGSSGSPVFNDQWEVIALHHYGSPKREVQLPDGTKVREDVNEGIRVSAIIRALRAMRDALPAEQAALIDPVLDGADRRSG